MQLVVLKRGKDILRTRIKEVARVGSLSKQWGFDWTREHQQWFGLIVVATVEQAWHHRGAALCSIMGGCL
jgi:hypothetical protein